MLFLPNHPALIDPVILMSVLWPRFRPRVLADRAQVHRPDLRLLMRRVRALEMADMTRDGRGASDQVEAVIQACAGALRAGDALLLYPAVRLDGLPRLGTGKTDYLALKGLLAEDARPPEGGLRP